MTSPPPRGRLSALRAFTRRSGAGRGNTIRHAAGGRSPSLGGKGLGVRSPDPLLSLRGVTVRYGSTVALDDVSLDVRAGERIALVGDSGCGKTTLLSVVSGYRRPTQGAVVRALGTRTGLLLQDPVASLNPGWTLEQIVSEPLGDRGGRQSREARATAVQRALAEVKLG
ncbi:MAG: ATP-binding cassette domain-containing protein, partial [Chloroflexota bacterium]